VIFKLAEACPQLDGMATDGDGRELVAEVEDVALELPGLLIRIRESGGKVFDLEVHPPSLHSVFIHLTGRELRE
jgi:ABC-2 type transport system ATP-binding protein